MKTLLILSTKDARYISCFVKNKLLVDLFYMSISMFHLFMDYFDVE